MARFNKNSKLPAILFAEAQIWAAWRLMSLAAGFEALAQILRDAATRMAKTVQRKMEDRSTP